MSHAQRILEHLETGQSITSLEAISKYGNTRLSASIHALRKAGHKIVGKTIPVVNRYGKTVYVTEYRLITEDGNGI